jgi:peptidoglycan/xylan/chitin deacetylase (PgdA/CDA1 family)
MNKLVIYIKHRKISTSLMRVFTIIFRYGFTRKKFKKYLHNFSKILAKYDVCATFPITANVLQKNHVIFTGNGNNNFELAIHGFKHSDYSQLSYEDQKDHLQKAKNIFDELDIDYTGFRFPYLRFSANSADTLKGKDIKWNSSNSIYWDISGYDILQIFSFSTYQKVLSQYNFGNFENCLSLPSLKNGIVEIPVSLPDDDLLVDRLKLRDENLISNIWIDMLDDTIKSGELLTLQLHPERIDKCGRSLDLLLKRAIETANSIWIANLTNISEWWIEKRRFRFEIKKISGDEYLIKPECSDKATILIKDPVDGNQTGERFFKNYYVLNKDEIHIKSTKKPILGIPGTISASVQDLLQNEGIPFEISDKPDEYEIYLDADKYNSGLFEREILKSIDKLPGQIIRFWRWPNQFKSALSITGDIDAITAVDFLRRF